MTKTHYRISLFPDCTSLCEKLAAMAAKSNGGAAYSLEQLKTVADGNILEYPTMNEGCTAELVGGCTLHIDRKIGKEYKTVLVIEQIEIMAMPQFEEANGLGALAD